VSTGVEKRELKRVTPNMWTLLRYAERLDGQAEIGGPWVRTANILARRGFCTLRKLELGWHAIALTDAGREALVTHGPRQPVRWQNRRTT
jgi:hypothetical protein